MNYTIIGNSAAAIGAVEAIRKVDQENPIILISDEPYHTYSRPLISYYLAGKVSEDKMLYREEDFYRKNGVETILGVKATALDTAAKQVTLADGRQIPFDKLLIATGGKPFIPPMIGLGKKEIYTFTKLDDVKAIKQVATPGKKVVIIGAGLIGLKAAEGLAKLEVDITVVELANRVLSAILDENAAAIVQKSLESHGIKFELNTTVDAILGEEAVTGVTLKNGKTLDCDFLIIAIGVVPNIDFIKGTDIQANRGIIVNQTMETSVKGIYAAGDCAEGFDIVYNTQRVIPILPNAYKQGETAGFNMAGQKQEYAGGFPMNSIGFFDLPMITAGIIKPESDNYEEMVVSQPEKNLFKKIVLKDDVIVGFIYLNQVDRAGILTGLIAEKANVASFKHYLLQDDFGYIYFPAETRKSKLLKGGIA